jgi:hypothetical protein
MYHHERGSSPPSDTTFVHECPFGTTGRRPGCGVRVCRGISPLTCLLPAALLRLCGRGALGWLVCAVDDGVTGLRSACLDALRIIGEGDLPRRQVGDHVLFANGQRDVESTPGAELSARRVRRWSGECAGRAGAAGRDPRVYRVLRAAGVWPGGAGVPCRHRWAARLFAQQDSSRRPQIPQRSSPATGTAGRQDSRCPVRRGCPAPR